MIFLINVDKDVYQPRRTSNKLLEKKLTGVVSHVVTVVSLITTSRSVACTSTTMSTSVSGTRSFLTAFGAYGKHIFISHSYSDKFNIFHLL